MHYVGFVGTDYQTTDEAREIMNREFPAYNEEMSRRGVWLLGRELDYPHKAATVRVRDGEMLVSDGPFAETKEVVGGFDVLDCADLDEAIEVESKSPVAKFHPFEIRPFREGLRMGGGGAAFAREDDSAGTPYLLTVWVSETPATPLDDPDVSRECEDWRQELDEAGAFVLGGALGGPETATTLRFHEGKMQLADRPFIETEEFIARIDVVSCAEREQAIALAAKHPFAPHHTVEVRPFYVG